MTSLEFTVDLLLTAFRAGKSGLSESQFRKFIEEKLHDNAETKEGGGKGAASAHPP
jgi:hypothetical protein